MPPVTHAGQDAATERGCIVQIQGDGNTVLTGLPHLRLTRYRTRRAIGTGAPDSAGFTPSGEREADLLRAYTAATPFVGRGPELERLNAWLDGPAPVSVYVLTGRGGRGKTRLALELCGARVAAHWRAGFVTGREMDRFRAQGNLAEWGWNAPTLVVLDYAAAFTTPLHEWLAELADNEARLRQGEPPLRLLLLERHAVPGEGWWAEIFGRGGGEADAIAGLLDRPEPDTVEAVRDPAERRAIFAAAYRRAAKGHPDLPPSLDARLAELSWGGEPLFLAMAGLLGARMGLEAALALPADELAFEQARRELALVRAIWIGRGLPKHSAEFATHLAALATLRGGLPAEDAHAVIRAEQQAMGFDGAGSPEPIRAAMHDALPGPRGSIAPFEPDPLGEAIILERWGKLPPASQTDLVLRAYWDAPDAVAATLVRTCQDFAIRGHRAAVTWLAAVGDAIAHEPDHVRKLLTLIPEATVELREIAASLTHAQLQHTRDESEEERNYRAATLNDLSIRLADLGRREEALAAIEECVELYRALAKARPDDFTPGLAMALNTLSNGLADLGRREEALAAIKECVELRRVLAKARPDAFTPNLATTLNNLSNHLAALGRREEALAAIGECVELCRILAKARLDAFTPNLATALNTLAKGLADLGRREEALAASEECVKLRRILAKARPDAFTPDLAGALNNLSNRLAGLGRREEALAAIKECVELRRVLAKARPDAFTPDLAGALNNLSNRLADLGRREEALAAIEECVELYRALAKARPDAFTPDLATSLNNLSNRLADLGRREEALAAIEECVALDRALVKARPDAFTPALAMSLNTLSNRLADLGRREEALAASEECVKLRRVLAKARPDAFTPDLARSLWVLGDLYAEARQPERALSTLREAVERLAPAFKAIPAAFGNVMTGLVQSYISQCEAHGQEPENLLLAPVLEMLERLRSERTND